MQKGRFITAAKSLRAVIVIVACLVLLQGSVLAQLTSPNYRAEETFFGTGGELDASSTNYRAKQSAGELGVGNTGSTNYQANAGFNTTDAPYLEFIVNSSTVALGTLSASATAIGNATFSVRTYLSSGYIVTATGPAPTNEGGTQLTALSSPTASSVGNEQFGMNLVSNSCPAVVTTSCTPPFGADPSQAPDGTFSFGAAASGYNTADLYKYTSGDTIASSTKSSGTTTYTMSYITNVSPISKAGVYTTNHILVATSTF